MSLFPVNSSSSSSSGSSSGSVLISFKAGKCNISNSVNSNGKHMINPDSRKGTVSLVKGADQLVYLKWTDRSTSRAEDERMVFPDELKCLHVKTGREGDRIYLLKYNTGQLFLMFWMQDKSSDKDKENCKKLNDLLINPNAVVASTSSSSSSSSGAGAGNGRLGSDQLMQMLGMTLPTNPQQSTTQPVPTAAAATTTTTTTPVNNILANLDFSSLLSGQPSQPTSQPALTAASSRQRPLGLEDILTADSILDTGIMNDPEVVASLIQYLPEDQRSEAYLEETLRSPQFRESLRMLTGALQSDSFNSVMMNFNIDPAPGMQHLLRNDAIGAFIAALQATIDAQNSDTSNNPPPPNSSNEGSE